MGLGQQRHRGADCYGASRAGALFGERVVRAALRAGNRGGAAADKKLFLVFGMLREGVPKLGHAEPMGLRFMRGRRACQRQAASTSGSEVVGKIHT